MQNKQRQKKSSMTKAFVLCRHGFRTANEWTPPLDLDLGSNVVPRFVSSPSFGAAAANNLLPCTLGATLPLIAEKVQTRTHAKKIQIYADSAVSRCQQTAVGWAFYLGAKKVYEVPTPLDQPKDPRLNHHAAEQGLDLKQWIEAQKKAAQEYRPQVQKEWARLLYCLGFNYHSLPVGREPFVLQEPSNTLEVRDDTPGGGTERAFYFLGLPQHAWDFANTIIMSFALDKYTMFDVLKQCLPRPREHNARRIFRLASRFISRLLATLYPKGYVAEQMSTAVARLALNFLKGDKTLVGIACSHEEHLNFFLSALKLDSFHYAIPTSCILFIRKGTRIEVYNIKNRVSRKGRIRRSVKEDKLGDIHIKQLKILARQHIATLPPVLSASTFGTGIPC